MRRCWRTRPLGAGRRQVRCSFPPCLPRSAIGPVHDPPQPAFPVLRPAHAAHRRLLWRCRWHRRRTSTGSRAEGVVVRQRVLPVAAVRAEPHVDAHRPPSVRAGVLDQRRLPALRRRDVAARAGAAGYRPVLAGRLHSMGPDQLHGYAERMVGDHSPNWGGVPRHDLGVLDKANDPWRESLERSGIGQSAYQVKDARDRRRGVRVPAQRWRAARARAATRRSASPSGSCCRIRRTSRGARTTNASTAACRRRRMARRRRPPHAWEAVVARESQHRRRRRQPPSSARAPPTTRSSIASTCCIGEVLHCLADEGLADDTLIVYTTDHGDQLGERGLWWKHTLYEDSVRVPLILRWPGRAAGRRAARAGRAICSTWPRR